MDESSNEVAASGAQPHPFDAAGDGQQDSASQAGGKKQSDKGKAKEKVVSAATRLVQYALTPALGVELFTDESGVGHVTAPVNGTRQTWLLRSDDCKQWLTRLFFEVEAAALNATARADAVSLLEAKARFGGVTRKVHVRVGHHDGDVYVDTCDQQWRAVRVGPDGWQLVSDPPVKFRRPRGMHALPEPDASVGLAGVDLLRKYLNVTGEDSWLAVLAWATHALLPRGPYAVLYISGQPGSAKTTASRFIRALVDPAATEVRDAARSQRDFAIAAHNSWVMALDNLSHMEEWLSDSLCRLATGAGFATRQLYSDTDEVQLSMCRPALLNAIEDVVTRSDLLERLLTVELAPIAPAQRKEEQQLRDEFDLDRPKILGGLLTLVSQALALKSTVELAALPRMADFARWGEAVARALGHEAGRFCKVLEANAEYAGTVTLDATPIYAVLERRLNGGSYCGPASRLLDELDRSASEGEKRHPGWPRSPNKLSGILRRITANLKRAGVEFKVLPRTGSAGRQLALWLTGGAPPWELVEPGPAPAPAAAVEQPKADTKPDGAAQEG